MKPLSVEMACLLGIQNEIQPVSIRAKNVSNMPWIVCALKRKKMARRAWVIFFLLTLLFT